MSINKKIKKINCYTNLTKKYINKIIEIYGWIYSIRHHSNVIFIDMMLNHEIVQCYSKQIYDYKNINLNDFVEITGLFKLRADTDIHDNLLGKFEIEIQKLLIINICKKLPFNIKKDNYSYLEGFKYRYLSLRNINGTINLIKKRQESINFFKTILQKNKFNEYLTPILCTPSPEGARDYIVPSRIHSGKCYSLPQSPQQFKQLLMLSGVSKYFQIAPCFRDEDSRKDRYIGEFYQIDVEMITNNKNKLIKLAINIVKKFIQKFYNQTNLIYKKIKYKDSIKLFGSDKPDFTGYLICEKITPKIFVSNKYDINKVYNLLKQNIKNIFVISHDISKGSSKNLTNVQINDLKNKLEDNFIVGCLFHKKEEIYKNTGLIIKLMNENFPKEKNKNDVSFAIVTDFPMFIFDEITQSWNFSHNPFCKPKNFDINKKFNPKNIISEQFDIVINGIEIGSGSLRNENFEILNKIFNEMGYSKNSCFQNFLECFQFGAPYHGGFALGLERLIMTFEKCIIQDLYSFPLTQNGIDMILGAPIKMDKKVLNDLKLNIIE